MLYSVSTSEAAVGAGVVRAVEAPCWGSAFGVEVAEGTSKVAADTIGLGGS